MNPSSVSVSYIACSMSVVSALQHRRRQSSTANRGRSYGTGGSQVVVQKMFVTDLRLDRNRVISAAPHFRVSVDFFCGQCIHL